jgi:hypothetical protein
MNFKKSLLISFAWLICLTITISAQKVSEKPFQKWSKDEALRVLSDSSWARTYQSTEGAAGAAAQQIGREQNQSVYSGGSNPRSVARNFGPPPVVIRLHSALPIRQAMIRLQQLGAGYDKMDEKKKADFDAETKAFLGCGICQNYYVVTITQFPNATGPGVEEGIFQRMTLKDMKGNVWLENEKGEQRELVQFTPPKGRGDSAVFFFARKDDKGNPFLTSESKDFKFVFKNDFLTTNNPYAGLVPRNFEFKVSKMMVGDNVEF